MQGKVSFVIPCYRSQDTIAGVVDRIGTVLPEQREYEIILVNDSSPDNTYDVIRNICEGNKRVKGIALSRNFGQHAAILAGLRACTGDVIVCLDDDGQTPPEEAPKLIAAVDEGHDVAIARYQQKKHGIVRNLGSKFNNWMAKVMIGKPKDLYLSSYVAMKRFVADQICSYTFPYPYISGMLIRATGDIINVDVGHKERESGESGYTMRKLLSLWFNGFTNFSIKPLRVAIIMGVAFAVLGFGVAVYAIVVKAIEPAAPLGWASQMSAITVIGGVILVGLGLIGEYIGRIYMGLNQQPQYVVKEKLNLGESGEDKEEK